MKFSRAQAYGLCPKVLFFMGLVARCMSAGATSIHDGDLDISYGFVGFVNTMFPNSNGLSVRKMQAVLQSDNSLLLAGGNIPLGFATPNFGILHVLADGTTDTAFGINGAALADFGNPSTITSVALQAADQKIVAGGISLGGTGTGTDFAVARFTPDGLLDPTFGAGGTTTIALNRGNCSVSSACDDVLYSTALQADGKILLAGQSATDGNHVSAAVVRLTENGLRDSSFNTGGFVTFDVGGSTALLLNIKQLADHQHILVVGAASASPINANDDFFLAKLDDKGTLDPSFGTNGKVLFGFDIGGDKADIASDFVELADGSLLVCGSTAVANPNNTDFACERFLANGAPDPSFAPVLIPFDRGGNKQDAVSEVHQDSHGRFLLSGETEVSSGNFDFALARLTRDGQLDSAFGQGGRATFRSSPIGNDLGNVAYSAAFQSDEKIVVAGVTAIDANGDLNFQVVRLIGDTIFSNDIEIP